MPSTFMRTPWGVQEVPVAPNDTSSTKVRRVFDMAGFVSLQFAAFRSTPIPQYAIPKLSRNN
jgi:hypothetical protein